MQFAKINSQAHHTRFSRHNVRARGPRCAARGTFRYSLLLVSLSDIANDELWCCGTYKIKNSFI